MSDLMDGRMMKKKPARSNHWRKVYEPGQPRHAFNILCEIDTGAALIRIVRRRRETVINLREYGLGPVDVVQELDKEAQ